MLGCFIVVVERITTSSGLKDSSFFFVVVILKGGKCQGGILISFFIHEVIQIIPSCCLGFVVFLFCHDLRTCFFLINPNSILMFVSLLIFYGLGSHGITSP